MRRRPPRSTRTDTLCPTRRSSDLGNLDLELSAKGADEITEMESALIVFRDTAREVEAANARAAEERERAAQERRRVSLALADEFEANVLQVVDAVSTAATELQATATSMQHTAERPTRDRKSAG